jgi:hypothetical protein
MQPLPLPPTAWTGHRPRPRTRPHPYQTS